MAPQVAGVHVWTHVLGVPSQAWFVPQVPQSSIPPQPSPCMPQLDPSEAQVAGVHMTVWPQTLGMPPPPHVSGMVQVPQSSVPPQPSPCMPQLKPSAAQVVGVHAVPHMLAVPPPPQVCPVGQPPQSTMPPQPSSTGPHIPGMQTEEASPQDGPESPASGRLSVPVEPPVELDAA